MKLHKAHIAKKRAKFILFLLTALEQQQLAFDSETWQSGQLSEFIYGSCCTFFTMICLYSFQDSYTKWNKKKN